MNYAQAITKEGLVRICSLLWADILVAYALFVMQNYLTDVWKISLTHAAGIINIWNGLSKILPVFFLFLVDAFMGHFMMLVISSIAYSVCTHNYDAQRFHKINERDSFTHTRFQRCLEKAAIILPGDIEGGEVRNRWKLCAVSEVEEAKIAVRMVPMWLTFIVCGMVSSIGGTYFIEQANHMNRKIGKWNVPLPALLLLFNWVKSIFGGIANKYLLGKSEKNSGDSTTPQPTYPEENKYRPPIGIGIAMVFSILCCITAAKIEMKRLGVIGKHGLLEKPEAAIPMSVYWLLFQFFLLAGLDAFGEKCVAAFYAYQGPDSMKYYLEHFSRGVFGLGFMLNVLSVHVVGKISERGGEKNWFRFTLNKSRLDRYYWFLAALSSVNLVVFIVVACCYRYKKNARDPDEGEANIGGAEGEPPKDEDNNENAQAEAEAN